MALGTQTGKIFIWDLNAEGQHRIKLVTIKFALLVMC